MLRITPLIKMILEPLDRIPSMIAVSMGVWMKRRIVKMPTPIFQRNDAMRMVVEIG